MIDLTEDDGRRLCQHPTKKGKWPFQAVIGIYCTRHAKMVKAKADAERAKARDDEDAKETKKEKADAAAAALATAAEDATRALAAANAAAAAAAANAAIDSMSDLFEATGI
jgi:hypothetical protein